MKATWKTRLADGARKAMPVIKVVKEVAGLAAGMAKPSLIGGISMVSAGLAALDGSLNNPAPKTLGDGTAVFVPRATFITMMRAAGCRVEVKNEWVSFTIYGKTLALSQQNYLFAGEEPSEDLIEWVRHVINGAAPHVIGIHRTQQGNAFSATAGELLPFSCRQGVEIWEATKPFLAEGPWTVLLSGRPGAGKTSMAHQIARIAELGRVVLLQAAACGYGEGESLRNVPLDADRLAEALRLVSASVVVIDDIDKVHISLASLEALRAARLVLLTANNGKHDTVLDGATIRPERVDEVFEISGERQQRRPPFDRLTDEQWAKVQDWPPAWMANLERRLRHRPDDLRLDDLESRLTRRTWSVDGGLL